MNIIKLDATESTNDYLKTLLRSAQLNDYTIVQTQTQTKGKGQKGAVWLSEPGKNLTFSLLKRLNFPISEQFYLNIVVSLAVFDALTSFEIPALKLKWPNDIMSGTSKIGGILIENVLKGQQLKTAVIGIGLNVNQTVFNNLSNVSSLKLLLHKDFNLDTVLNCIVENLKLRMEQWEGGAFKVLKNNYMDSLFRLEKASTFKLPDDTLFIGKIVGVTNAGLLQVFDGDTIREFNLKEVRLLF